MNASRTLISRFVPKPFLIRLGVGVVILNVFVLLTGVASLRQSLRNHRERAVATAQNLTLVLDHFVADTISKADLVVWAVKDEVERAAVDPTRSHRDRDAFLRRQHERVPGLMALRTTDAEGLIDHSSGPETGPRVSLADQEYFIRARDVPEAGLVISKPLVGKRTGTWVIALARRLERPNHGFAGIAYAVIALDQFEKAFSALEMGQRGAVALRDLELGLIARYPKPTSAGTAVGERFVTPEFVAFTQSGQISGIYQARTPYDQVQRTFSIRRVSGWPFYLLVGLAEQDYLRGWWWEVVLEFTEVGLFIGLTLAAFWLIRRAWFRQQVAHENLERMLTEVKTLGGMVPICSHCKKIRDDKGYWNQIEAYLNQHIDAEFTHGICPDCAKEIFPLSSGKHTTL